MVSYSANGQVEDRGKIQAQIDSFGGAGASDLTFNFRVCSTREENNDNTVHAAKS